MHDHDGAVTALIYLPPAILTALVLLRIGAQRGVRWMSRLEGSMQSAPGPVHAAALLMLMTGVMHAGLVPAHLAEKPILAVLFTLGAVGMVATAVGAYVVRWWRIPAAAILLGMIGAYGFVLVTGQEDMDAIGVATKLVELAALAALLVPATSSAPSRPAAMVTAGNH